MYQFAKVLSYFLVLSLLLACSGSEKKEGEAGAFFANTILVPISLNSASLMRSVIWPSPTAGKLRLDIDAAAEGYLVTPEYLTYALVDEKISKIGRATFWVVDGRVMWTNTLSKELAEDFKLEMEEAPKEIKDIVVERHAAARIADDTGWDKHIKEYIVDLHKAGYSINVYE